MYKGYLPTNSEQPLEVWEGIDSNTPILLDKRSIYSYRPTQKLSEKASVATLDILFRSFEEDPFLFLDMPINDIEYCLEKDRVPRRGSYDRKTLDDWSLRAGLTSAAQLLSLRRESPELLSSVIRYNRNYKEELSTMPSALHQVLFIRKDVTKLIEEFEKEEYGKHLLDQASKILQYYIPDFSPREDTYLQPVDEERQPDALGLYHGKWNGIHHITVSTCNVIASDYDMKFLYLSLTEEEYLSHLMASIHELTHQSHQELIGAYQFDGFHPINSAKLNVTIPTLLSTVQEGVTRLMEVFIINRLIQDTYFARSDEMHNALLNYQELLMTSSLTSREYYDSLNAKGVAFNTFLPYVDGPYMALQILMQLDFKDALELLQNIDMIEAASIQQGSKSYKEIINNPLKLLPRRTNRFPGKHKTDKLLL